MLRVAGAVESASEHSLARAIVAAATARSAIADASDFRAMTGRVVDAAVEDVRYAVGGPALLREGSLTEPVELASRARGRWERGAAVLDLVRGDEIVGALALEDEVCAEAAPRWLSSRRSAARS